MKTIAKRIFVLAMLACLSTGVMAQLTMRVTQKAEAALRIQQQQRLMERSRDMLRLQANLTRESTQSGTKREIRQLKRESRKPRKIEARATAHSDNQIGRGPGRVGASHNTQASGSVAH